MSVIDEKYAALGGPTGFLGAPIIQETSAPDGIGLFRHYQGGSIYWTPQTGAHEIHDLGSTSGSEAIAARMDAIGNIASKRCRRCSQSSTSFLMKAENSRTVSSRLTLPSDYTAGKLAGIALV